MVRTRAVWLRGFASLLVLTSLIGCGVRLQDAAEPLPANVLPGPLRIPTSPLSASQSASPAPEPPIASVPASSLLRVWFVQDDGLAAVESALPVGSSSELVLQYLTVGPATEVTLQGLRTVARDPLTGRPLVTVVTTAGPTLFPSAETAAGPAPTAIVPEPASVTVALNPAFSALPPSEQVLLLGQVVLSLASAGAQSITFVDDSGSPAAVPLPDGRLLDTPATARDYASLIVRP